MKKILLTLIGMVAGAALVHAQGGLISWQSATAAPATNSTMYATGYPSTTGSVGNKTPGSGAGLFYFALLAATSTTASDTGNPLGPDWSVVNFSGGGVAQGTNNLGPGTITGNGGSAGFASSLNGSTFSDACPRKTTMIA